MRDKQAHQNGYQASARPIQLLHVASTLWFVGSAGFILVTALRQAGVNWLVIFTLSWHSALIIFLLISVYLLALFRGVNNSPSSEVEHPLTSTDYYMYFYVAAPLVGGVAGLLGSIGVRTWIHYLNGIALGTFAATFVVWVVLDPAIGLIQTLLPEPRKSRTRRINQQKAMRQERQRRREQLITEIAERAARDKQHWQSTLEPSAQELAHLLTTDADGFTNAEQRAVEIGIDAWRLGGLGCMRRLHEMTIDTYDQSHQHKPVDYLSQWWDGIGAWRTSR